MTSRQLSNYLTTVSDGGAWLFYGWDKKFYKQIIGNGCFILLNFFTSGSKGNEKLEQKKIMIYNTKVSLLSYDVQKDEEKK